MEFLFWWAVAFLSLRAAMSYVASPYRPTTWHEFAVIFGIGTVFYVLIRTFSSVVLDF